MTCVPTATKSLSVSEPQPLDPSKETSPEFFRGQTTSRSDQYSLGVTYHQLRTGEIPFNGSLQEIMDGHLHREPNLEGLNETEKRIVKRALEKNPDLRWASCVKFIGELQRSADADENTSDQHRRRHWFLGRMNSFSPKSTSDPAHAETADLPQPMRETLAYRGRPVTTGLLLIDEELVPVPLKRTDFKASVTAATAEVKVTQRFRNSMDRAIEATYVFPLPEDAAVNRLQMQIEDRIIEGVVREKQEARQTFEEAKQAGHGAALLEEDTPNIFTSSVANILPGQEIRIEITYIQPLPFDEGQYRLVLPMVVSPRYVPGTHESDDVSVGDLPTSVTTPRIPQGMLRGDTVSVEIDLDAGVPLCGFDSPSHDIETLAEDGPNQAKIRLQQENEIPNRDFVLNYRVTGPQIESSLICQPGTEDELGTFVFLSTPPRTVEHQGVPRELIFVLDRSGSMDGQPLKQAKQAVGQLIESLEPMDRFNLIAFDHTVTRFSDHSVAADPSNVRGACKFLDRLEPGRGTEMLQPLRLALQSSRPDGAAAARMVVFVTDGSVDGEREMLAELRDEIGQSRIVGFGIGTAVNRHWMNKLTQAGRGFAVYIYPGENITRVVDCTLRRLSQPILTDVQLLWQGDDDQVEQVLPAQPPDLYQNRPLMVVGRYRGRTCPALTIQGHCGDQAYEVTIPADDVRQHDGGVSLRTLWARQQIEALMDQIWEHPEQKDPLREQVIRLAIEHRLASELTSFLAIEYRSSAERQKAIDALSVEIPQLLPDGMFEHESPLQATCRPKSPIGGDLSALGIDACENAAGMGSMPAAGAKTAATSSTHPKLSRVRRPRVHLSHETDVCGATSNHELPFVIGVLSDLGGEGVSSGPLGDRRFTSVDRDNFADFMQSMNVSLKISEIEGLVPRQVSVTGQLTFRSMNDFELGEIRQQLRAIDDRAGWNPDAVRLDPQFRRLKRAWQGLCHLILNTETGETLRIEVLQATKEEMLNDLAQSSSITDSTLHTRMCTDVFEAVGGRPFNVMIGDYSFGNDENDRDLLERLGVLGEKSQCVFLGSVSPSWFGLESFLELNAEDRWDSILALDADERWNEFRMASQSRFVVLTLPNVLTGVSRVSKYPPDQLANELGIDLEASDLHFEWINAVYLLAECLAECYAKCGTSISMFDAENRRVAPLPDVPLKIDSDGVVSLPSELSIDEGQSSDLSERGFVVLRNLPDDPGTAEFSDPVSLHRSSLGAPDVDFPTTIESARFMHHMRCIMRSRGGFDDPVDVEDYLTRWLEKYVSLDAGDQPNAWARYPLISAEIEVTDSRVVGCYRVEAQLQLRRSDGKVQPPICMVADPLPRTNG